MVLPNGNILRIKKMDERNSSYKCCGLVVDVVQFYVKTNISFIFLEDILFIWEREREREIAPAEGEGEADSLHREPNVGFDPGSPGSRPGPKAGAKPLHHPGIPKLIYLRERTWVGGKGRRRGRSRLLSEQGAQHEAPFPGPWGHDLSRRQTLNWLSHPGAPSVNHFNKWSNTRRWLWEPSGWLASDVGGPSCGTEHLTCGIWC